MLAILSMFGVLFSFPPPKAAQKRQCKIVTEELKQAIEEKPDAYLHELAEPFNCTSQAVDTFDWKATSGNSIEVNRFGDEYTKFNVEISEDEKVLTITPALTSSDSYEIWVSVD